MKNQLDEKELAILDSQIDNFFNQLSDMAKRHARYAFQYGFLKFEGEHSTQLAQFGVFSALKHFNVPKVWIRAFNNAFKSIPS